jgi:hypothetical protein
MEISDLQSDTLIILYRNQVNDQNSFLESLDTLKGMDEWAVDEAISPLFEARLVEDGAGCGTIVLTHVGIRLVENELLADDPTARENREVRDKILHGLARIREEEGSFGFGGRDEVGVSGLDPALWALHVDVLQKEELVKALGGPFAYQITPAGFKESHRLKTREALIAEFQDLSGLIPQQRGTAFQKFLGRLLEFQGWRQQEGVKTEEEEIDVIINRGYEYFLFECKWEKDPIGAAVIREFFGKLFKRSQTKGIVVSYSGFTGPAVLEAANFYSHRPILLMGPEDIKKLVSFRRSFDEIVSERYDLLVTKRISIFR